MILSKHDQQVITKYDLLFEQRMTRVETVMENLVNRMDSMERRMTAGFAEMKTDFRWLVLIMLTGFGTLFGLMAHGFHWWG